MRVNILGNRIRMFIERINKRTKCVKRRVFLSFIIYVLANIITLEEMNKTVDENNRPIGSKIIGTLICLELIRAAVHSKIKVFGGFISDRDIERIMEEESIRVLKQLEAENRDKGFSNILVM